MTMQEYLMVVWSKESIADFCPVAAGYTIANATGDYPYGYNDCDRAECMIKKLDQQVWSEFAKFHGLPLDMTTKEYWQSDFYRDAVREIMRKRNEVPRV